MESAAVVESQVQIKIDLFRFSNLRRSTARTESSFKTSMPLSMAFSPNHLASARSLVKWRRSREANIGTRLSRMFRPSSWRSVGRVYASCEGTKRFENTSTHAFAIRVFKHTYAKLRYCDFSTIRRWQRLSPRRIFSRSASANGSPNIATHKRWMFKRRSRVNH